MRFYDSKECEEWCRGLGLDLNDRNLPKRPSRRCGIHFAFPQKFTQLLWLSRCIESALQPREDCLLWVTDRVFSSNENQHLYYRWRQSYGDIRLLHEAPGHLCLDFERPEVVTLVHLAILFGWDLHLVPSTAFASAFVCHDEFVEISFDHEEQLEATKSMLEQGGLRISTPAS